MMAPLGRSSRATIPWGQGRSRGQRRSKCQTWANKRGKRRGNATAVQSIRCPTTSALGYLRPPRIAPVWRVRRRSELFNFRPCRWACRQVGNHRAEARRNRSPRCLHGTMWCFAFVFLQRLSGAMVRPRRSRKPIVTIAPLVTAALAPARTFQPCHFRLHRVAV